MDTEDSQGAPLLGFTWERDGEGNPTSLTETGTLQLHLEQLPVEAYFDADNRLTDTSEGTYEHDANGNLIFRTVESETTEFGYDSEDRLVKQKTPRLRIRHIYDGDGHRIARTENGVATRYILDRGRSMSHLLCETDENGRITAYYLHGPQIIARIDADGTQRHHHTNDIGTVMALTDEGEQVTDRYAYTPYGLEVEREGTTANPFTYVGGLGVMAEHHGLYFMRARFYDPAIGRFLGKDPVEGALTDPQGLHRYVYGRNNPLTSVDPSGLIAWSNLGRGVTNLASAAGATLLSAAAGDVVGTVLGLNDAVRGASQVGYALAGREREGLSAAQIVVGYGALAATWAGEGINAVAGTNIDTADWYDNAMGATQLTEAGALVYSFARAPFKAKRGGGGHLQFSWRETGRFARQSAGWMNLGADFLSVDSAARSAHSGLSWLFNRMNQGANLPYIQQADPFWFYRQTKEAH